MKRVLLWFALLWIWSGTLAAPQPILLKGIATDGSKPTRPEVMALIQQAGPGLEDVIQKTGDGKCVNKFGVYKEDLSNSLVGSFTRKGANQKILNVYYCDTWNEYHIIGIFESGKLLLATYSSAFHCSVTIEKYPDINSNGTNEVGINENGGQGCLQSIATLMDFNNGKVNNLGDFQPTSEDGGCAFQIPGGDEVFNTEHQLYVSKGIKPLFYEKIYKSSCIQDNAKPALVKNLSHITPAISSVKLLKLDDLIASGKSANTTPSFIGSSTDLLQSSLCKRLKCIFQSKHNFPGNITFTSYQLQYGVGIPKGLFSYQVDGKHRMIGFYSWGAGTEGNDLNLSKTTLDAFIADVLTTSYASTSKKLFIDYGADGGGIGFDSRRDVSVTINSQLILSNITSKVPNSNSGYTSNGSVFSVAYIADKDYSFPLSKFLNRQTGAQDIQNAGNTFLKDQNLKLIKTTSCGTRGLTPDGILVPDTTWRKWEAYFAKKDYIETVAAPGGPYLFTFPGLAASGVTLDREAGSTGSGTCLN